MLKDLIKSDEQRSIIKTIKNHNVCVLAVAGSAKTTTGLMIAEEYPESYVLLLVYNARLKDETRMKQKNNNLSNLDIHDYHSFAYGHYDECTTDIKLRKILDSNTKMKNTNKHKYDILVIDETQDLNLLYFELVCKIYKDFCNMDTHICLFGDQRQMIYGYKKNDERSDVRFMTLASKIYPNNGTEWKQLTLSTSYRLTDMMSGFINNCVLPTDDPDYGKLIRTIKNTGQKIKYLNICPYNYNVILEILEAYLNHGYKESDIFILAYSCKSIKSPIIAFSNHLKEKHNNLLIYIPMSDEEELKDKVMEGKLVFSTFHKVKGLERKIVFVFGFDESYFNYYDRESDKKNIPNPLYVAITRASEHLILIKDYKQEEFQFIKNHELLRTYVG